MHKQEVFFFFVFQTLARQTEDKTEGFSVLCLWAKVGIFFVFAFLCIFSCVVLHDVERFIPKKNDLEQTQTTPVYLRQATTVTSKENLDTKRKEKEILVTAKVIIELHVCLFFTWTLFRDPKTKKGL